VEAGERDAAELAAHWAAEMEKVLAYRRDVERREGGHHAAAQHRLEWRIIMRHQEAAIHDAMVAIDGTGPASHDDGAAQL
jgi:hypothetical protein